MVRKRTKNPRLSDRDWEILDLILRYRIVTAEILHGLYFDDSEPNAVTKVTSRLVRHGFLARHRFLSQRSYFTLGKEACKILGASSKKTQSLGPQALATEFGMLAFCFQTKPYRKRLKVTDIHRHDDTLIARGLDSSHYYFDISEDGTKRFGLVRVEQGSTPSLIARRCDHELRKRLKIPSFKRLINNDQFVITVVTSTEQKKEEIHIHLRKRRWRVQLRISVVPELIQLNARNNA